MSTRLKVRLDSLTRTALNGATLTYKPVTSGSEENKLFYKRTPMGEITFSTVNEAVADAVVVGAEYYVDITPA